MPRILITNTTLRAAKSYDRPNGVRQPVMVPNRMRPNPVGVLALASVNGRGAYRSFLKTNCGPGMAPNLRKRKSSSKAVAAAAKKIAKREGIPFFDAVKIARQQASGMPGRAPGKAIASARKTYVRRKAAGKKVYPVGSGESFKRQVAAIRRRGLSEKSAKAIAAAQMRKAYGNAYSNELAARGRRRAKTKRLRSNPEEKAMRANFTKAHNARAARAMRMAVSKGISLKAAWKVVKGGKAAPKARSKAAPKRKTAAPKRKTSLRKWAWHGKRTGGKLKSYRVFAKKTGRTKGHHVRNVTKAGVLGSGTLMVGAGRKRRTVHFSRFVSVGPQRGKGKRLKVYYKNARGKNIGAGIAAARRTRNVRATATGIGTSRAQEPMYQVGGDIDAWAALSHITDPKARRRAAAKLGKHKYSSKWQSRTQTIKKRWRMPVRLGGFPVGHTRSGRPIFVHKGRHISVGQWNEDPYPGYSAKFPDDPHVVRRGQDLVHARAVAKAAAHERAARTGSALQKRVAKLEAQRAKLEAKIAGLSPSQIDAAIDEGKYMYSPNRRRRGGKRKSRRSGRRGSRSLRRLLAALRKTRPTRRRRRLRANKRRSHRRVRVIHMSANRRRRHKRKGRRRSRRRLFVMNRHRRGRKRNRRGMFMNRRHRRRYRRNAGLDMYAPSVKSALYVFGGFAVHKLLRGLLGTIITPKLGAAAPYGVLISGLIVAAAGVPAAAKFVPAHGVEIGAGMVVSFLHDLFMVLANQFAPASATSPGAAHYLSGYGAIPMQNTTGYSGYGYMSERGFQRDAAAKLPKHWYSSKSAKALADFSESGHGTYDVISDQYRGYGVAPYAQAAAGYGEYEPMSGTLDGLHGDNASIEAALNAADMPEQAAAGYGVGPYAQAAAGYGDANVMQAAAGFDGMQTVNTWIPNDPSLAISGFGGVF